MVILGVVIRRSMLLVTLTLTLLFFAVMVVIVDSVVCGVMVFGVDAPVCPGLSPL
jgi:hypothetical protein